MTHIKFNNYHSDAVKDPAFKREYEAEYERLASAVTLMRARKSAGWTQTELAHKAQVPQSKVAEIESGSNISADILSKIAFALNNSYDLAT